MIPRASDTDREEALAALQHGFAEGRLSEDELRTRIDRVLHANTVAELRAVTVDLPPRAPVPTSTSSAHRGRHGERPASDGLRPTEERFRDPTTQRVMRVWLTPTGERCYLPD